ncbi:MAG: ABC transporter ATP-binding protein [Bacteroidales bacterium]|nr:ABC transporter ATP-binding protein [Bacteroidales bacterium]
MIKAENIHKSFDHLEVLKGINLQVKKGEIISIVGASGAGKSTLLHILGTIDSPDQGNVWIDDVQIKSMGEKKLAEFRNGNIGFVFQFHHLLPEFTALENVCIPAFIRKTPRKKAEDRAKYLLDYLKMSDRLDHKPSELSGGEQQRVAVARALINEPAVILADEPSGNLDSVSANDLHRLFFDLREKFDQTLIIVTHNQQLADMADRKLTIKDGVILNGKHQENNI